MQQNLPIRKSVPVCEIESNTRGNKQSAIDCVCLALFLASQMFKLIKHSPKGCQRGLVCSRNQLKIRNALHQCPLKLSVPSFKLDPFRKNKAVVVTLKSSANCLLVQNETLETSRYQKTGSISNVRYTLPSLVQDTRYTLLRFVQDSKVQFPEHITSQLVSAPF